jgi:hypothetical protein
MHSAVIAIDDRAAPSVLAQDDLHLAHIGYWAVQLCAWGWLFWRQATGEAFFASVPLSTAATLWGVICLASIVTTDTLRRLGRRWAWVELPTSDLLIRLALSVAALTATGFAVATGLSFVEYGTPVPGIDRAFYHKLGLPGQLFNVLWSLLLPYLTWTAVYFSAALSRHRNQSVLRQARLSESLQAAELRLLKSQLNPHFLFNALNGVRALIADEPARAQDAVTQLARTLRYTLDSGREEFVSLARELEMVEDYLALESLRLNARLRIVREIDAEATAARVPVMLLQGLVENAIKHGIAPLREGGTLRMAARLIDKDLYLEVENPRPTELRPGLSPGLGLKNAARRLDLLFGSRARIELDLSDPRRAKASARTPL